MDAVAPSPAAPASAGWFVRRSVLLAGAGAVLFLLQMRRSRRFPGLLFGWLLAGMTLGVEQWNAASIAWLLFVSLAYFGYLTGAPRIQRTFFGRTW